MDKQSNDDRFVHGSPSDRTIVGPESTRRGAEYSTLVGDQTLAIQHA
jgi:hypothetical protein